MASRLQAAPGEYLSMSFEDLDQEYVRGEIIERSLPDYAHGRTQARLNACSETRMRLAPDLYRIPDVAVFAVSEPEESVPSLAPFVAIEIISPDDRYSAVLEKLAEYQQWGVPHIRVVDPHKRTLAIYDGGALLSVSHLTISAYPIELSSELFS